MRGRDWQPGPPLDIQHLRRDVCRQMRRIDALLRETGLGAQLLPQPEILGGALCAMGGTAFG
ncbi:hypothetical protein [Rubrivivax gelatinosus]|uniref:Uncharacterized protein n=1 Tax=Rubrivivax gelatinosus TaxID=28068 RepID=A0ABS1DT64_RUBGE|nr:hypothetical protein [Rubrivivax gelatinosus]MBK1712780.1 hypothetical protein [Rubrivivax gelatinosus]